ncbi:unnamed protein product, partial [Phaeothamnion confervicola]
ARKAIQASYDGLNDAMQRFDLAKDKKYRDDDYVFTRVNGRRLHAPELRKRHESLREKTVKAHSTSKIFEIQLEGNRAYVMVKEHFEGEFKRSWVSPGPKNIVDDDIAQDVWTKGPSGWRLTSSTNLENHTVIDGK